MAKLQNNTSKTIQPSADEETTIYDGEIDLIDYFRVLWKRKIIILLGSVLPALVVGLILFIWPRGYKVTYVYDVKDKSIYDIRDQRTYDIRDRNIYDVADLSIYDSEDQHTYHLSDWNLSEKNYKMLLERFFSEENIDKIVSKLRENNLEGYAALISRARAREDLERFVNFKVSPPFVDIHRTQIKDPFYLEQFKQMTAQLLNMTIVGKPKNNISKISLVVRDNLENVVSVYRAKEQLSNITRGLRSKIADIEEENFDLELTLKTNKAVLAKLKNIETPVSDGSESNISLQFDISGKTEYLPVEYQIQAAESKATQVEGQITANKEQYGYCKDLLALNKKLLSHLNEKITGYYTIQQFHLFLTDLVNTSEVEETKNYLSSYIKRIENQISSSIPVVEKPKIHTISKGTLKKSAVVFVMSLIVSVFAAFLLEGIHRFTNRFHKNNIDK